MGATVTMDAHRAKAASNDELKYYARDVRGTAKERPLLLLQTLVKENGWFFIGQLYKIALWNR